MFIYQVYVNEAECKRYILVGTKVLHSHDICRIVLNNQGGIGGNDVHVCVVINCRVVNEGEQPWNFSINFV